MRAVCVIEESFHCVVVLVHFAGGERTAFSSWSAVLS